MAYTDDRFPEFIVCRDPQTGVCEVCGVRKSQGHIIRDHEAWEAADEATWD